MVSAAKSTAVGPRDEVRVCHSCSKPTLVCLNAWHHSFGGQATDRVTRDCRCQTCGAVVILRDRTSITVLWVLGFIMLVAVIPGLVMLGLAYSRSRAWKQNPLAPGAPYPEVRYKLGPGERRCGHCGGECHLEGVTRHRHNGIPTGTDYDYACRGCANAFRTESIGGLLFSLVSGGLLLTGAFVFFTVSKESAAWRFGGSAICLLGGGVLLWQSFVRIGAAIKNPLI